MRGLALVALAGLVALLPVATAAAGPARVEVPQWFDLHGYLRGRGGVFHNHDLDRGPTPTTDEPVFPVPPSGGQVMGSMDMRLRLDLGIHVGDVVTVHARIDGLDNVVLGSTPEGYPRTRWAPMAWATTGQEAPSGGTNAFSDSVRLKRAYGEVFTPLGVLAVGRMGLPRWGLGMVAAGSDGLDDDFDDDVDRIGFVTSFRDHFVGVSFDLNAIGPTTAGSAGGGTRRRAIDLELKDNVFTLSAALGKRTPEDVLRRQMEWGRTSFDYGLYVTYRWQQAEFPEFYLQGLEGEDEAWTTDDAIERDLDAVAADLWLRLQTRRLRLELELAYLRSRIGDASMATGVTMPPITSSQLGVVFQVEVSAVPRKLEAQIEVGLASGDDAPGLGVAPALDQYSSQAGDLDGPQFHLDDDLTIDNFRFHPNHVVDVVFWRQIVGTVTDAFYTRVEITVHPSPYFTVAVAGIPSWAVKRTSTPSGEPFYGFEVDLHARWRPVPGFEVWGDLGLFLPGSALDNTAADLDAKPALGAHLMVAFPY